MFRLNTVIRASILLAILLTILCTVTNAHTFINSLKRKNTRVAHKCNHDKLHEKEKKSARGIHYQLSQRAFFDPHIEKRIQQQKLSSVSSLKSNQDSSFRPIRITFRTDYIDKENEEASSRTCYEQGKKFKRGDPHSISDECDESSGITSDCWDTCTNEQVVTDNMINHVKDYLIPKIQTAFQEYLSTRELPGILRFPTGFDSCGAEGGVPIPGDLQGAMDPNIHDAIMFVTMRPTDTGVLGWAVSCLAEPQYGRPIVGHLNLSPSIFKESVSLQVGVILHETTHALGFSSSQFDQFVDENGSPREDIKLSKLSSFTDAQGILRTKTITYLKTPELLKRFRNYFNCSLAEGVPLEEFGGSGTAGSHFEKKLFMNDLMVGSVGWFNPTDSFAVSEFVLALLQDSGWYRANFTAADSMSWGYNMGCSFVQNRCEKWGEKNIDGYYCDSEYLPDGATRLNYCTYNHRAKGYCDVRNYGQNMGYYEHLTDPQMGGPDEQLDYCPIVYRYANGRCSDSANTPMSGEKYGSNSGCFDSNLSLIGFNRKERDARCFQYQCSTDNELQIIVDSPSGNKVFSCPKDESYMRIEDGLPYGMSGYITCPQNGYTIMCKTAEIDGNNQLPGEEPGNPMCDWFGILCNSAARTTISSAWVLVLVLYVYLILL